MANNFKKGIDRNMWIGITPAPNAHAAGISLASDLRNSVARNPFIFQLVSGTVLNRYNVVTKAWNLIGNPALGGTFGAGAISVFIPSLALLGNIGAGCTSTSITTSTVITAVGINMLANRGGSGDYGFKVRIIGLTAGKVEERWIVGNTGGTTPTLTLDAALTFVPTATDKYEILSGRLFMLSAGTASATTQRTFEVAANAFASLSNTNLPATISSDSSAVALDEQYVPYTRKPGEGFVVGVSTYDGTSLKCLQASAIAATSITGQATAGDAAVLANEYRNFQIRIVEDTTNPTAVGQRAIIASHTAGPSAVYTIWTAAANAWLVTPSVNAKFVIEYPNLLLLWTSATAVTYTYNYGPLTINNGTASIAANAWNVTYFGNRGGAIGVGCTSFASFGIEPDPAKNARHSMIHSFRGGATMTLDILNIAGAIAGTWENVAVYDGGVLVGGGTGGEYAPVDNEGRMGYLNIYTASQLSQIFRYDVKNRVLSPFTPTDWIQAGTAAVGSRLATYAALDGATDKYSILLLQAHLATNAFELVVLI